MAHEDAFADRRNGNEEACFRLGRCGGVASASRSVFGFGPTISQKERRAIEHITSTLERPPRW